MDKFGTVSYLPIMSTTEDVTDSSKSNSNVDLMNSSHKETLLVKGDWPPLKISCLIEAKLKTTKPSDDEIVRRPQVWLQITYHRN